MTSRDGAARRPRLMLVVTSAVTVETFLPGLVRRLARSGWDVTIACSPAPDGAVPSVPGARVIGVGMRRDPSPVADLRAARGLWSAMRATEPDVVATATPKAGLLGTLVARGRRVPVVVHLMWGLRSETLAGRRGRLVRLLEGVATRYSHAVVPNSASLATELSRLGMVDPRTVTVIGSGSSHGVDLARFRPAGEGAPAPPAVVSGLAELGAGPVVGFVGRLTADKGITTLLDAVRLLRGRGQKVRLLLVGAAEDLAVTDRIAVERAAGLPVLVVDRVTDTAPLYKVMDVHCLPSLREGFPNVCLEASACAVPTVTTDATGAVDSVLDGHTGRIVGRGDPDALADALGPLLDDPQLRARMGRAARDWVEQEFGAELVERRHVEYLAGLLGAPVGAEVTS
ncbi:glycosyltransferase family 4 protein [Pseudonocardia sp. NPDC046786]|uniref:glycosyltransferase family 4 protein n=1 Tax=Pseudonocardia sp. NPDC046786 TaxID=3155471 RepID=UPI00341095B4